MATIKDVAKQAKVSVATVSNVLNKTANVSEEKIKRVITAMEQLKFSPNVYAKGLRQKANKLFAIILSSIDATTTRIVEGIVSACKERNCICNLYVTNHNRILEANYLREMQTTGINGIFLQTCESQTNDSFNTVLNTDIPVVLIDNYIKNSMYPAVIFNNTTLMEDALLEYVKSKDEPLCKKNILFVSSGERYANDGDAQAGVERVFGNEYERFIVPAREEDAFFHLTKYFETRDEFPSLFISPRESITAAICQLIEYFGIKADVIHLADDKSKFSPSLVPLHRRAYHLGTTAAEAMFRHIHSPLQQDKMLTVVGHKKCFRESPCVLPRSATRMHLTLYDGPTAAALMPAIKSFRQTFGVQIDYTLLDYDALYERIVEIGDSKSDETDVFMIDLPWFETFNRDNHLAPLNPFIEADHDEWLENFTDEIKKTYFYTHSVIYSVPILTNMQYIFYRRDLFEHPEIKRDFFNKYGIELTPPKSWREFEVVAKFFTRTHNPNSPVVYGTALQGMDPIAISNEFFPRQWAYGGKLLSSRGTPVLNSQENYHAFSNLKNVYQCTPGEQIESSWEKNFTKLTNNEIAMYFNFSTHIGSDNSFRYSVDFSNIAITKAPSNCSVLGGYNLGINAYGKNKELSYRFIKWLTSKKMAIKNTLMGCCIPHNSVLEDDKCINAFPWLKNVQNYVLLAKRRENLLDKERRNIPPKMINTLIYQTATEIFRNEDIQTVLNAANKKLDDMVNCR